MNNFELNGPFKLSEKIVEQMILEGEMGVYILGSLDKSNFFIVEHIGRSSNLVEDLIKYIPQYSHFKIFYFDNLQDTFDKECVLFHDFNDDGVLDDWQHPEKDGGTFWQCPVCGY